MAVPLLTWSEGPRIRPRCCVTWPELGGSSWGHGKEWCLLLWNAGLSLLSWAPLLLQIEIQTHSWYSPFI